ncbi:putative methyltransferase-domain-containing protein [Halteromyces radiatus]|uniref:putative methyltransferase-domain-containing protein n=1 Tax=Halteromyces radiatus TaxID=101107 RepID=UPI00221EDB7D|nr:putative methyltransferase-domain-containing protein [Halteromyces radiatus]KAI8081478.1 putative methyltransferase-domain-containing protein [Halteromyces radiatus]
MGKRSSVSEEKPIATVEGWEDGQHYQRPLTKLDRWELQSADKLTIHIDDTDIVLVQDPHSNHLGGYVWLSSIVFCTYLSALHAGMHKGRGQRHEWIHMDHGKRWVELGSGVGLIGLMLHRLGIEHVMVTDIAELVPTLERNVEANGILVQSITGRRKNEKSMEDYSNMAVVVEPLLWNDDDAIGHVKSAGPIDYIVACDCIYSEASAVGLVMTMDKLAGPDTIIICLSEVRNQAAQDTFMEQANRVFSVDLIPPEQWRKKVTGVDFDETLNLYRLCKSTILPHMKDRRKKKSMTTTVF